MFEDLTLFFSASKKDLTLYPVRQKLALVVVWVVFHKVVVCLVSPREIKGFSGQPVTAAGIFLGGLWIPYGYPKFSDPLQNRRLLPLKEEAKILKRNLYYVKKIRETFEKIRLQGSKNIQKMAIIICSTVDRKVGRDKGMEEGYNNR